MSDLSSYALRIRIAMHKTQREIANAMQSQFQLELTRAQFYILKLISEDGPCTITELARKFGIHTSSVSTMLNKLVQDNLISREYSHDDRRKVFVSITEYGSDVLKQELQHYSRILERYLSPLNEEELETFVHIFEKISSVHK
ncbi:MarR family transcriptional regulator [Paenibacillus vulneris]|uniref:MarR family winged helix-turn-helix transcriptional regulator n=1 Tax=Paenibacillus vulneris TaxID=1133364 RepID=A0ABW3USU7_9BACL|nr:MULTISPECIES: MarR family transcriptional regulator [unclassified Paenibacillus]MBE1440785.1 DNA-binding MarR family transcriptional regulator [Paenibacillus sp. OAS669]